MKKMSLVLVLVLSVLITTAQTWTKVSGRWEYQYMRFDNTVGTFTPPQDTIPGAPAGSLAVKNDIPYYKTVASGWVPVTGAAANLATTSLVATGDYTHNWKSKQLFIDSTRRFYVFGRGQRSGRWQRMSIGFEPTSNLMFLLAGAKQNAANNSDSVSFAIQGNDDGTLSLGGSNTAIAGGSSRIYIDPGSSLARPRITLTTDTIRLQLIPSASGDSVLVAGPFDPATRTNAVYKSKITSGSTFSPNNIGFGYRWLYSPDGLFRSAIGRSGITIDTVTDANAVTFRADTGLLATNYKNGLKLNISDTANKWMNNVRRRQGTDTVEYLKNGAWQFAYKDSVGSGSAQNIVDTVNKYLPTGAIRSNAYYFSAPGNDSTWQVYYLNGDLFYKKGGIVKMVLTTEDDVVILDSVYFIGSTWDAFGDSYTFGVGASPSSNKYISLLETSLGMTANNVGESGTGIMDVQFKMYRDFAAFGQANRNPTTLLIGFNDYLKSSSGVATQAMFPYAFRAAIFNHFLDTAVASNDPNLITTGSWSTFDLSSSYPQKSKYLLSGTGRLSVASSAGDSKTYAFDGQNVGIMFFGANGTTQDYGRLKIEIDGIPVDTVDENGIADDQTVFANSGSRTEDLISSAVVYTGLSNGAHSIKATLLDNKNTNLDAFGVMEIPTASQSMVVGSVQKLLSAGYTAMSAGSPKNSAGVDATNLIISNVVNEFRTLGYPIVYVDVNTYTDPNVDIDTDNIHWDNSGHAAGKNAFRSKIRL